jgi:hypothetical protein
MLPGSTSAKSLRTVSCPPSSVISLMTSGDVETPSGVPFTVPGREPTLR